MNNFQIVAISITIIFLPPMLASLYFYSFPSSTTTTTFPLFSHHHHYHHKKHNLPEKIAVMYFIDHQHEKTKKKIKNVVSPALIIQHANTNSDIVCFIAKPILLFSFVSNVENYNVVFFS